jgi:hypothetical protein
MVAYYNEFDPKAAAWLRELIRAGLIAYGDVDERAHGAPARVGRLRGFGNAINSQAAKVWIESYLDTKTVAV